MYKINSTISKKRFNIIEDIKRSKYKDKNWYKFFAHSIPFCYVFYILEKLKLVYPRPWRVEFSQVLVLNNINNEEVKKCLKNQA